MKLASFDRAREDAVDACVPLDSEVVTLEGALGRTLRETLVAREDIVPYARSAMDGYAVRSADTKAGASLPVAGQRFAGPGARQTLGAGTASAIATGAPLPEGADAVVPFERVRRTPESIELEERLEPGDHVFPPGDDARAGEILAAFGKRLDPGTLALLAAAGHATVRCARRPRVSVVTTGEELVDVAESPGFGQIRNSNATMVAASALAAGAEVAFRKHVGDERAALRATLEHACAASDLVVTTGGASVGERDFVKSVLDELGAEFVFRGVALRPGRPTAFARLGDARILALPGNPAAAFVTLHAFGIPVLRKLAGSLEPLPRRMRARLRGELHGKGDRTYLAFVRLSIGVRGRLEATPLDNQCSSLTRTAAGAAAFAVVHPKLGDIRDGQMVDVDVFAAEAIESVAPKP